MEGTYRLPALPRPARNYSNWELSADRANSARRILMETGLAAERIVQVRGFADVALRNPEAPEDPTNRRNQPDCQVFSRARPPPTPPLTKCTPRRN